jgi:hypothetical protein
MPVKFYPDKPIDFLENYITKEDGSPLNGEIDVYRALYNELSKSEEEWHIWHDLRLPRHSKIFNRYKKTSAQIDFLILCKEGIVVVEVKGGNVSLKDNTFYYGRNFEKKMKQDPFVQAEGYKHTLKDDILNNIGKCFFCHAVVFPHVDCMFDFKIIDENILWTKYKAPNYGMSIENFIKHVFRHCKAEHKKFHRIYPELERRQIDSIRKVLSPIVNDSSKYDNINILEWLQVGNLEILESLSKNRRIMIEGPPGSGKTTLARAYIDLQIGKKGLYICWNQLLMYYTQHLLEKRTSIDDIEVYTLSRFVMKLDPSITSNILNNYTEDEYYDMIKNVVDSMQRKNCLPYYDYVVIDEGQDIFDKGVDILIDKICGFNRNGLIDGNILMLYDIDQSYLASSRSVLEVSDILRDYFAHFKLSEVRRSAQNPDIKKLANNIFEEPTILLDENIHSEFPRINITRHKKLENVKRYIVKNFVGLMRDPSSSLRGGNCILLIESRLLKDEYKGEPGMKYWLGMKDVEELGEQNICDSSNKLRYTSILRYKGLEKDNVFLVISEPSERNRGEIYVGITRAINNLEILIVET